MQTKNEVIQEVKLWKKNNIHECLMEFSCGGDSMNDYSFNFFDNKGKEIICEELKEYFDNEVFNRVEFYECSDGHYIGEFGDVQITLNNEEDGFEYYKRSKSEWSESFSDEFGVSLSEDEIKFFKEKVESMNGGDGEKNINYKIDCVITDNEEEIVDSILERIDDLASEHEFENTEGEPEDFYRWTTDDDNSVNQSINIVGDKLYVSVTRSFMVIKEEDY
jgi:hypothetical protein